MRHCTLSELRYRNKVVGYRFHLQETFTPIEELLRPELQGGISFEFSKELYSKLTSNCNSLISRTIWEDMHLCSDGKLRTYSEWKQFNGKLHGVKEAIELTTVEEVGFIVDFLNKVAKVNNKGTHLIIIPNFRFTRKDFACELVCLCPKSREVWGMTLPLSSSSNYVVNTLEYMNFI